MARKRSSLTSLPKEDRDAALPPADAAKRAHFSVLQAEDIFERALFMWFNARQSLEDAHERIAALVGRGALRRQHTATLLAKILDAAIDATGADMGNIQVYDPKSGHLHIRVHRGFHRPFLDFFNSVDPRHAACGTALKGKARVVVPDIAYSPIFSGTPLLEVMLDANVRAVQSTPLISNSGRIQGMISTHYKTVTQPGEHDLRVIDYLSSWAAEILEANHQATRSNGDASASKGNGSTPLGADQSVRGFSSAQPLRARNRR